MRWLSACFEKCLSWSRHRQAPVILALVSFIESLFFPLPPDTMLIPMALAQPKRAYHFAALVTATSVLGGLVGYWVGWAAEPWVEAVVAWAGMQQAYQDAILWSERWGSWAVFMGAFTPIPYKLFTVGAGVLRLPLSSFVLGSMAGRMLRFFCLAWLIQRHQVQAEAWIRQILDRVGWGTLMITTLGMVWLVWTT